MTYDPFTAVVEPLEPLDNERAVVSHLHRSMLWDLVGPIAITKHPEKFGQNPASEDVLNMEYREMLQRKTAVERLGYNLPLLTQVAVETASQVLLATEPGLSHLTEEGKLGFRMQNARVASVVTDTVVSHLLQGGIINFGGNQ